MSAGDGTYLAVRCGQCGGSFLLSYRREFYWRKRGEAPTCRECRNVVRRPELTDEERDRFTRWWLERSGLSLRELDSIARGLPAG